MSLATMDSEINKSLKLIGEHLSFEFVLLTELSGDANALSSFNYYLAKGVQSPSPETVIPEIIPWIARQLQYNHVVSLPDTLKDLPTEAQSDKKFVVRENIQSFLALPLKYGKTVKGALFLLALQKKLSWNNKTLEDLDRLGKILAGAMERRHKTIEEKTAITKVGGSLRFEQLLSDISATYINLPAAEVEKTIKFDLGRLGKLLDVDRCVLYLASEDEHSFKFDMPFVWLTERDKKLSEKIESWRQTQTDFFDNLRYVFDKWSRGEPLQFSSLEELPKEAERIKQLYSKLQVKSILSIPISVMRKAVGALVITTTHTHRAWSEDLFPRLRLIGEVFANALIRKQSEEKLEKALSEIKNLKERFEADYMYLSEELKHEHDFGDVVAKSEALKQVISKAMQVAPTNATVLLLGETGTGKGLIARTIHNSSKNKNRPLVQINCAALNPGLVESELFGHERGAFTGALQKRQGRFEIADGTTLFLDEIGELSLETQAKLLRILQDGEFERVGGNTTIKTNVRIIAATNRNLENEVAVGKFRQDLWYRLSVFPIYVPPLRERKEDIPLFVGRFVDKYSKSFGKHFTSVPHKIIKALQEYSWPGNVRELENVIERAVIASPPGQLTIALPTYVSDLSLRKKENPEEYKQRVMLALKETNWKVEGANGAARRLGLKPGTLRYRMKKLSIERPRF